MGLRESFSKDGRMVLFKDNPATRLADRIAELNSMYGTRASGGGVPSAPAPEPGGEAPPTLNSGLSEDGGGGLRMVAALPPEEQERLNRRAVEAGLMVDDSIPADNSDLEPAADPPTRSLVGKRGTPVRGVQITGLSADPAGPVSFTDFQTIDLKQRLVYVGGFPFPYGDAEARAFGALIVGIIRRVVDYDLEKALANLREDVLAVPGAEATVGVPPAIAEQGRTPGALPLVPSGDDPGAPSEVRPNP